MLDFLKNILGDACTEDISSKIEAEIAKAYVTRADHDALSESKTALETQLATANNTIEGFKAMDIDGIKAAADQYKQEAAQARADAESRVAEIQFNTLLDGAISKANGRNGKAIRALLDVDALRGSKNQSEDIAAALKTCQTENGYLFDTQQAAPPYATGTGTQPMNNTTTPEVSDFRIGAGLKNE